MKTQGQEGYSAVLALAQNAVYAMLLETACHPSPGLVSPQSTGSHGDMNYFMFLASSSALAPYYLVLAEAGRRFQGQEEGLLDELRAWGLRAEADMFAATGGVNTQKGLLFSLGLSVGAAGYALRYACPPTAAQVRKVVEQAAGPLREELEAVAGKKRAPSSKGDWAYLAHGLAGVRGEAIRGFPAVFAGGLPALRGFLQAGYSLNDCLVGTLVHLMAFVADTTVLARRGPAGLERVRAEAQEAVLLGSIATREGRKKILAMERTFAEEGLNPGGSADLLALTVFFYLLEERIPAKQLLFPSVFRETC